MRRKYPILLLLPLAACATPEQQCVQNAMRDLQVLDALIVETNQNVSRGYALEQEIAPQVGVNWCLGNYSSNVGLSFCSNNSTRVRERPVAIDVDAERQKLASLEAQRAETARRAEADLAACQAQFGS